MQKNNPSYHTTSADFFTLTDGEMDAHDIPVLTAMARCVMVVTRHAASLTIPHTTYLPEPSARTHRIVMYAPPPRTWQGLPFVGFVSKKRLPVQPALAAHLGTSDQLMIAAMAGCSGLITYSSLELADGNWCNLVVFMHTDVKDDILAAQPHQHAAYELAPHYYEWVRIHHGVLAGDRTEIRLHSHKTKYYAFTTPGQRPGVRVQTYAQPDTLTLGRSKA